MHTVNLITGNKVPLYDQVAQTLQQRVRTRVYQPGKALPPVRALSSEFGVSVKVIQNAVRKLEARGIVETHHGKGVMVTRKEPCERAAILFGMIHPYSAALGFRQEILEGVDEAFSARGNIAVIRSSKDDAVREREIAEHLVANGAQGLVLWPTNDDRNAEFFEQLARRVPVVLVDRLLPGADLPAVVLDYPECGRQISRMLLGELGRKRLLVLRDDLHISSYQEILSGIESGAAALNRSRDYTVVQLPISRFIENSYATHFAEVPRFAECVERLLSEGGYDAVFCTQDEFLDLVIAQTGLAEKFPDVRYATVGQAYIVDRRMKYLAMNCLEWVFDFRDLMARTADLVQEWVLSRRAPKGVIRVRVELKADRGRTS